MKRRVIAAGVLAVLAFKEYNNNKKILQNNWFSSTQGRELMKHLKRSPPILWIVFVLSVFVLFSAAKDRECTWTGIEKIVAIGDLHGDYENFVTILKEVNLLDEELLWIGGSSHLVQTGDVLDRGPDARRIFDLIKRLEGEAEQAGGMVHMLIGNHEEMNITGIAIDQPRYVTQEQFLSFLSDKYRKKVEKKIQKEHEKSQGNTYDPGITLDDAIKEHWANALRNDQRAKDEYTNNFNKEYGKWIIEHNTVIKINDTVFVHGGLSEKFSQWKLKDINKMMQVELEEYRRAIRDKKPLTFKPKIVYKPDGPLWFRDLAGTNEGLSIAEVDQILNNLEAKQMVIAHTPRTGSRISLRDEMVMYEGRIWVIDTGISKAYGGFLSALIIEDGQFNIWEPKNEE
jgi:hypothetical protein